MSTTLFIDCSGSTQGHSNYWNYADKLIKDNKESSLYYWDTRITASKTYGGTAPIVIAQKLCEQPDILKGKVVILTDGQISSSDIEKCRNQMSKCPGQIQTLEFHIKEISSYEKIDGLSVVAPFAQFSKNVTLTNNDDTISMTIKPKQELLDIIRCINTCEDIEQHWQEIIDTVTAMTWARTDSTDIINELRKRRSVILSSIADDKNFDPETATDKEITDKWTESKVTPKKIESFFNKLMDIQKKNTYNFSSFKANVITASDSQKDDELESISETLTETVNQDFECQISLDNACRGFMMHEVIENFGLKLHNENSSLANNFTINPLSCIDNKMINDTIKDMLGRAIGYQSFSVLKECPFSRRAKPIFICLENTKESVQWTNYQIRKLFFNNKVTGNITLVLMFIYWIIKDDCEKFTNEYRDILKEHIDWRLQTQKVPVSLCGIQEYPQYKTSMSRALKFCVRREFMIRNCISKTQFECMLYFSGLDDQEKENCMKAFNNHIKLYELVKFVKANPKKFEKMALEQSNEKRTVTHDGITIEYIVDGYPNLNPDPITQYISTKSFQEINSVPTDRVRIPWSLYNVPDTIEVTPVKNYAYRVNEDRIEIPEFHPKTGWLPIYRGKEDGVEYCNKLFGGKYCSIPKDFCVYIHKNGRSPSKGEFLQYLVSQYNTLPNHIEQLIDVIIKNYESTLRKSGLSPSDYADMVSRNYMINGFFVTRAQRYANETS